MDDVEAKYSNGILEFRIPCPESTEPAATRVPDSSNLIGTEIPHGPYWLT